MPLAYTSDSGAENDQLEIPTSTGGSRFATLRDISGGGTVLPDGDYIGEPLVWDEAGWAGSEFVRFSDLKSPDGTGAFLASEFSNFAIEPSNEFSVNANTGASTLVMNASAFAARGDVVQIAENSAINFLTLTSSTWDGAGVSVSLGSTSGAGLALNVAGVEIGCGTGQVLRLQTSGLVRFEGGDSYAQLVATDSSVTVNDVGEIDISTPGACNISGSSSVSLAWSAGAVNMTAAGIAIGAGSIGFFDAVPALQQSITGATTQDQVDSLVAALVALGLATDDR
jgi:hypothetical protein